MSAPDTTKFQVNYKLSDGTLINLYAASVQELETGLTDLAMVAQLIKSTGKDLGGVPNQSTPTVAAVAAQLNATPINSLDDRVNPPASTGGNQVCRHGEMAFRSGTSAKGPWKGYMCAAPKGATDKCDTIWIR